MKDKLHYALAYIFILYFSGRWIGESHHKLNIFCPCYKERILYSREPKNGRSSHVLSRMNLASEWKHGLEDWTGNMTQITAAAFGRAGSSAGRLCFHCSEWSKGILEISNRARRVYTPGNVEQEDRGHFRETETGGVLGAEEALSERVKSTWHSKWFWVHHILCMVDVGTVMSKSNTSEPWRISRAFLRSGSERLSLPLVQVHCWRLASVYKN